MTSITVPNPWAELPREEPIVATVDRRLFDQHPEWRRKMDLGRLPTPFLGTPEATVFVLSLHPSGGDVDSAYGAEFDEQRRRELQFASDQTYYSLNPEFAHTKGASGTGEIWER